MRIRVQWLGIYAWGHGMMLMMFTMRVMLSIDPMYISTVVHRYDFSMGGTRTADEITLEHTLCCLHPDVCL